MFNQRRRLLAILAASLITGLIIILLRNLSFPPPGLGRWYFIGTAILATNFLAAVPGALLLHRSGVAHSISLSAFAVIEAYLLTYGLALFAYALGGWGALVIAICTLVTISYFLGDLILNRWNRAPWQRGVLALSVIIVTALASNTIPELLYRLR